LALVVHAPCSRRLASIIIRGTMTADERSKNVDIGQSKEERDKLLEELAGTEDKSPPRREGPSADDEFAALQAQGLGSGALGTDPSTR
jgi:hypothetical protein